MGNSPSAAAVPALCAALGAFHLANHLDPQQQTGAGTAPPPLGDAARAFLPVAALGGFCASVALLFRHIRRAGNQRLPGHVAFPLCASAGLLIVAPAQGGVVDRAAARALGLAALRAVPGASAASFFLGMLLIIVGHIRAGGEGGGGAVAGDGPIGAPVVRILAKAAMAATVALLFLTAIAVCFI
ncbi:unnamed protein product [Urochloa decumbens]|uniref:Uncharacterized protein n=1 Tax=Urochloa decumbens TaxID=240449 RepID=A0ABC9DWX4_9POAL